MPAKDPDMIICVTKSDKDTGCPACRVMEEIADNKGETQHVLYIEATVESVFEKKLNRVTDKEPHIQVLTKEDMK